MCLTIKKNINYLEKNVIFLSDVINDIIVQLIFSNGTI